MEISSSSDLFFFYIINIGQVVRRKFDIVALKIISFRSFILFTCPFVLSMFISKYFSSDDCDQSPAMNGN